MKYLKKQKKPGVLPVLCVVCALLAVIAAVVFLLAPEDLLPPAAPSGTEVQHQSAPAESGTREDPTADTPPQETLGEGIAIDAVYCDLWYPAAFSDHLYVDVREDGGVVAAFYARLEGRADQALFDILLGGAAAEPMGAVKCSDGSLVPVGLRVHELDPGADWSQAEKDTVLAMQEALNEVLTALAPVPYEPDTGLVEIETPCGVLYYPGQWRDYLQVEQTQGDVYTVEFYGKLPGREAQLLFCVRCGGGEAGAIAVIQAPDGTRSNVHVTVSELFLDNSWSADEQNILYSMQEGLNDLLDALAAD